ncbi:hypothetical protein D3C84_744220 [compost metagenome]
MLAKQPIERAQTDVQLIRPLLRRLMNIGSLQEALAQPKQPLIDRQRNVQRQVSTARQLMQQQRDQRAIAPGLVVRQRNLHRLHQQMPHQRRNTDHLTTLAQVHSTRLDVQTASAHPQHQHLMRHPRRNPHRPLRRHHPVAIVRADLHHPGGAVQQLRPSMRMTRQHMPVGIIRTDRHHRPRRVIQQINRNIAHQAASSSWRKHKHYWLTC